MTYKTAMVGAINHIEPEINHCVEDIFCHCCPLTITLHKTLTPTTHSSGLTSLFFFSTPHRPQKKLPIGLERTGEVSPVNQPFSIKVKVFRVVYMIYQKIQLGSVSETQYFGFDMMAFLFLEFTP